MKINGVEFTAQEEECIRIALDHFQADMEEQAEEARDEGSPAHVTLYSSEAEVAARTREKFRQVVKREA